MHFASLDSSLVCWSYSTLRPTLKIKFHSASKISYLIHHLLVILRPKHGSVLSLFELCFCSWHWFARGTTHRILNKHKTVNILLQQALRRNHAQSKEAFTAHILGSRTTRARVRVVSSLEKGFTIRRVRDLQPVTC